MITEIVDYGDRTLWEIVSDKLIENDIEVYPEAIKKRECKSPYVVLKQDGKTPISGISSKKGYFMVMLYVPQHEYQELDRFETKVTNILNELIPLIHPVGQTNTDYYDDNFNAHMRYVLYRSSIRDRNI